MAAFTGTHGGYSYSVDWSRDDGGRITWDAVVHTAAGNWCGHPNGAMPACEPGDSHGEARVRLAVEEVIGQGSNRRDDPAS
jgi:hypothetical protein